MEGQGTHAEISPAEGQRTTGGNLPELASLTEMVHVMIEDREHREREIAEERESREREIAEERDRREREREEKRNQLEREREEYQRRYMAESERRITEMHRQMERLQQMFAEQSVATASARGRSTTESIKLTRLTEEDDIESYLTTFERVMEAHEVSRERWSFQLATYLTGRAQQAYAGLRSPPTGRC